MSGYTVLEAENGRNALVVSSDCAGKIDLLMTDVVMPEMGGRELAEKMAANCPGIVVLFTSGYTDDAGVRRGVTQEQTNFIQKPYMTDDLTQKKSARSSTNKRDGENRPLPASVT